MKIVSFDDSNIKIRRDIDQDNLFNLFQKNIMNIENLPLSIYIVPREYEMRLDRISQHIYGSPDYIEELMIINDIINPYSVKEGQYIYFCPSDLLTQVYTKDEMLTTKETKRQSLIKSSQPNRDKQNTTGDNNLSPTIKPANLDQLKLGKDNTVQIINKFQ